MKDEERISKKEKKGKRGHGFMVGHEHENQKRSSRGLSFSKPLPISIRLGGQIKKLIQKRSYFGNFFEVVVSV